MNIISYNKKNIHVHLLMLLSIILAASSFPVVALITNDLPPSILMFFRFFIASLLFAPFVFLKHGFRFPGNLKIIHYVILSIPLVTFFWCMFESLRYTSVLNTGALYTTVPAITAFFAYIINRETSNKIKSTGLLLGTVGALWIVFRGNFNSFINLDLNYGDLIFLTGCLFLGLYNPLVKRFYHNQPMAIMTFWVLFIGSLLLLIISADSLLLIEWNAISNNVYIGIVYLSLFSTLITFYLIHFSTVRIGPTNVAAYGFLTPLFVISISILTGIEKFNMAILPGLTLIIISMMLIQFHRPKDPLKTS